MLAPAGARVLRADALPVVLMRDASRCRGAARTGLKRVSLHMPPARGVRMLVLRHHTSPVAAPIWPRCRRRRLCCLSGALAERAGALDCI